MESNYKSTLDKVKLENTFINALYLPGKMYGVYVLTVNTELLLAAISRCTCL